MLKQRKPAKLFTRLAGALLPQSCVLCLADSGEASVCQGCAAELPWATAPRCPVCAIPTPQGLHCGACLKQAPAFDHTVAAWWYQWPLDRLIPAYKYAGQLGLTSSLADGLLAQARQADRPQALLAMPLHPDRLRERGFNQSYELAKQLASALDLPLLQNNVVRTRLTPPQASLPLEERHKAIRGVFQAAGDVTGQHIALVDDVMTSGASLHELAKTLKAAGASRVDCWILARTI
ncbi:ComF family protein [Chitinimonas sp.]|uniref:ComF family protein n=1 Tax=Chitinimonas sp. TaxID=1934313 RepID=UPI002F943431